MNSLGSNLAHIARRRVQEGTRLAFRGVRDHNSREVEAAKIGTEGAVAFALLDVASAIRELPEARFEPAKKLADELAEEVLKPEPDESLIQFLANSYQHTRGGIDQWP